MVNQQRIGAAKALIVSASLAAFSLSPLAAAQEFTQPVEIQSQLNKRECEAAVIDHGARNGLMGVAQRNFQASEQDAERLADHWSDYMVTEPKVKSGTLDYRGGICRGELLLTVNGAKMDSDLALNYSCDRPVVVLSRLRTPEDESLSHLDADTLQATLMAELGKRKIAIVDATEMLPSFRKNISTMEDCAYTGQDEGACTTDVSLSESIGDALRALDHGITYAFDKKFRSTKLLPLANGGVLLVVTFDVVSAGTDVTTSATVHAQFVSDGDIAWTMFPIDAPDRVRSNQSTLSLARDLFRDLSYNIAQDAARQCSTIGAGAGVRGSGEGPNG